MQIFFLILVKLLPLYFLILLGYITTKGLKVQKEAIAKILIYVISPAVVFFGTAQGNISSILFSLPVLFFVLCSLMAFSFLFIGARVYKKDATKNLLALTAGTANTGYFGLPVALHLLGDKVLPLVVLCIFGFQLFESSVGFYLTAKGNHDAKESFKKVIRLPSIYAFFSGLIISYTDFNINENLSMLIDSFKGGYTLFGMMIIGMGLATVKIRHIDFRYLFLSFTAKFVVWPLLVLLLIACDKIFLAWYNQEIYNVMILMAIVPLAANTVALSAELNVYPDKAALAVLLSSLFALFYIPFMSMYFMI